MVAGPLQIAKRARREGTRQNQRTDGSGGAGLSDTEPKPGTGGRRSLTSALTVVTL